MEERLNSIVQAAPESVASQKQGFWMHVKKACCSKPGILALTFVVVFVLLLTIRPTYIFKKTNDGRSRTQINYVLVVALATIAAAIVVLIPLIALHGAGS